MASLKQRILGRSLPVGLATALVGYGLLRLYLGVMGTYAQVPEDVPVSWLGVLQFGLVGFALSAAIECVRHGTR